MRLVCQQHWNSPANNPERIQWAVLHKGVPVPRAMRKGVSVVRSVRGLPLEQCHSMLLFRCRHRLGDRMLPPQEPVLPSLRVGHQASKVAELPMIMLAEFKVAVLRGAA